MGWKASTIFINTQKEIDYFEMLNDLGFLNLIKIEDEPFEVAIFPGDKKVYVGNYKENLIICIPDLPLTFFDETLSEQEKILIKRFPNTEICSIAMHSVVNYWGYSVIINGQKIRARAGSADHGTFTEFGEPLDQEKELLSKSTIDKDGNRTYIFDDFPDEPFTEDQVGENFVFEISSRYIGTQPDKADELLFDTILIGYSYSENMFEQKGNSSTKLQNEMKNRPWWKIW